MAGKEQNEEEAQFLQEMDGELVGWDQPEQRLQEALEQDHLCLYYQPIVSLAGQGSIAMAEILVRLREEEERMLPPGEFLPAFEHFRMMDQLDRWVLRHAVRKLAGGGGTRVISVNASSQSIEGAGFAEFAAAQMLAAGLSPDALVVEIEESELLDQRAAVERFAGEVREAGCRLMLDGFARRSVSFEALRALKPDFVKVDGAVTRKIARSGTASAKMKAIQRLGDMIGIGVVAECVEEPAVLAALKQLKVGYAQGFGVGKPEPIENLFKN
jgi:EAL domain-containing protein (putative c-di-GMP-specific phosphodiesterase class I)